MLRVEGLSGVRIQGATADFGRPALVDSDDPSHQVSHGELEQRVARIAANLPPAASGRRLVQVPLVAAPDVVIGYLAVLLAGHVALITTERADSIVRHYRPDLRLRADGGFETLSAAPQHLLHPELAVLISTSGSTGSPKLVRLSQENIISNAEAIVEALAITPEDRAITSLPLHYCFGLSVLHAQLRAGATVALRTKTMADADIGDTLVRLGVSMVAVTPHLIDLLDVQGVLQRDLPDLRLVAQAGGALPAERVKEVAARGRARGWSFTVMYGQTEATARMSVLDPDNVTTYPDAVGWPVAESSFRLDTSVGDPADPDDPVGELVFSGPGVMLGYAEHPDDLALGRMQTELRTGDLARIAPDGLVRILGRRSDFAKIMGIRIDLGQIEHELRDRAVDACVTAAGDTLQVTYRIEGAARAQQIRELAAAASGLGPAIISVRAVKDLPRTDSGKLDRSACAALHRELGREHESPDPLVAGREPTDLVAVAAALGPLLGRTVDPDRSFVELGGDSFCHVQASLRLGRLLGDLPPDWHHRPLRELPGLARSTMKRRWCQRVETNVLLRAAAVVMICGSHVGLFPLAGGAHVLLAVAGFTFGRFVMSQPSTFQRWQRSAQTAVGIAVPAVFVAVVMVTVFGGAHWTNIALVHWAVRPDTGNIFWFVEALLMIMIGTTALLSAGGPRNAYARDPWRFTFLLTVALLVPRYVVLAVSDGPVRAMPWAVAWLFTAGLAMAVARSDAHRILTMLVAVGATVGFYPAAERNLVIIVGLILLALVPAVAVPNVLVRPLGALAAASLHIYLIQFQMFAFFSSPALKFAGALVAGLVFWLATAQLIRRLQCRLPLIPPTYRARMNPLKRKDHQCADALS